MKEFFLKLWEVLKTFGRWARKYLAGPGVALLVVIVAVIIFYGGYKKLQIGGILDKLLGRDKKDLPPVDVVNTPPSGRVDQNGNPIPVGTPDAEGHTQIKVVPLEEPGLFSNPNVVRYTPPGADKPVELQLPVGVKNTDVKEIVYIKPEVVGVAVHDASKVQAKTVSDLLNKYGA